MIWQLWKHSWVNFFYVKEANSSYLLSDRMFVLLDILSDSNIQLAGGIFFMPDISSGAWKKLF